MIVIIWLIRRRINVNFCWFFFIFFIKLKCKIQFRNKLLIRKRTIFQNNIKFLFRAKKVQLLLIKKKLNRNKLDKKSKFNQKSILINQKKWIQMNNSNLLLDNRAISNLNLMGLMRMQVKIVILLKVLFYFEVFMLKIFIFLQNVQRIIN